MTTEGHQVASHTWSHANLSTLSENDRITEMVSLIPIPTSFNFLIVLATGQK